MNASANVANMNLNTARGRALNSHHTACINSYFGGWVFLFSFFFIFFFFLKNLLRLLIWKSIAGTSFVAAGYGSVSSGREGVKVVSHG